MLKPVKRHSCLVGAALAVIVSSAVLDPSEARGQDQVTPVAGEAIFNVFVNSTPAGIVRVSVVRTPSGWHIASTGQIEPANFENRLFEVDYDDAWRPRKLSVDATRANKAFALQTTFEGGNATSQVREGLERTTITQTVSPDAIVLPDYFFGAYEAMAVRLSGSKAGTELPVYAAPSGQISAVVQDVFSHRVRTVKRTLTVQTYRVIFQNPQGPLEAEIWVDQDHRLLRVSLLSLSIDVARQDIVAVSTRLTAVRLPGDAQVQIPSAGFSLAGTITTPVGREIPRDGWPAVLLVPGTRSVDRDENMFGIPLFSQLASGLAEAGYLVMRYDKRGVGQSGGRPESAKLEDHADDVRTLVRYLDRRDDVDDDRITVVGHGEGGWVGLQAASQERRIDAVTLLAVPSTPGTDLVLEQQHAELDRLNVPASARAERIALQARIHEAVLGNASWENIPENVKLQADTIWFRSFLTFDPAEAMRRTRQPLLIVHGELDKEVPLYHADRLAELALARTRRESTVDVTKLTGINHLLARAATGDVDEYSQLPDKQVASEVTSALTTWLSDKLPPRP